MATISAADVKRLREMTSAGMMECKKALEEHDLDEDAAAGVAQHARCQKISRPSQLCMLHRDCVTSAFERAQNFARKRANISQILFDLGEKRVRNV